MIPFLLLRNQQVEPRGYGTVLPLAADVLLQALSKVRKYEDGIEEKYFPAFIPTEGRFSLSLRGRTSDHADDHSLFIF